MKRKGARLYGILAGIGIFALSSLPAMAGEKVTTIYAFKLEHRLKSEIQGDYAKYFNVLLKDVQDRVEFRIANMVGVAEQFIDEKNGCITPVSKKALLYHYPELSSANLIESSPIDVVSRYVFTKAGSTIISTSQQLDGLKIATLHGYPVADLIPGIKNEVVPFRSPTQGIRMLLDNRIDALVGHMPDIAIALDKSGTSHDLHYDRSFPLLSTSIHIVCHNTPLNRTLITDLNRKIQDMETSGQTHALLSIHASVNSDKPMN